MGFGSVRGHDSQKEFLAGSVARDRVAHAYLFCGPEGVGKKLVALEFAKLVNCAEPVKDGGDCGCLSCSKTERGLNPDVHLFDYPDEKTIKVGHVREDVENVVHLSPYENPYKVFIIDGAERMNFNAQNAFLKTLEEPPRNSVIILITPLADLLIPTVRSRCQAVMFRPLPEEEVRRFLESEKPEEENPGLVSRISGGSIGKAMGTDEDYMRKRTEYLLCAARVDARKPLTLFDSVEKMRKEIKGGGPGELGTVFDVLSSWIRDAIVLKTSGDGEKITNADMSGQIGEYAEKRDVGELLEKFRALEETMERISSNNANVEVSLENLLLRFSR